MLRIFNNCSLCDRYNLRKKVCLHFLAVCAYRMKSVVVRGFFREFAFANKALKTFVAFQICWKCSNSNLNFVPSLMKTEQAGVKPNLLIARFMSWNLALCSASNVFLNRILIIYFGFSSFWPFAIRCDWLVDWLIDWLSASWQWTAVNSMPRC